MKEFKQIPVEEASRLHKEGRALFVDIRDPASFQAAHVPGALHLSDQNVEAFVAGTPKEKAVVIYCYHGHTSQGAAAYFLDHGFQEVYSVMGGFEGWRQTEKVES